MSIHVNPVKKFCALLICTIFLISVMTVLFLAGLDDVSTALFGIVFVWLSSELYQYLIS